MPWKWIVCGCSEPLPNGSAAARPRGAQRRARDAAVVGPGRRTSRRARPRSRGRSRRAPTRAATRPLAQPARRAPVEVAQRSRGVEAVGGVVDRRAVAEARVAGALVAGVRPRRRRGRAVRRPSHALVASTAAMPPAPPAAISARRVSSATREIVTHLNRPVPGDLPAMGGKETRANGPRRRTRASCRTTARRLRRPARSSGETTGSDEPATEEGIDRGAGDDADATTDGGAEPPPDAEPDLKDVGRGAAPRGAELGL